MAICARGSHAAHSAGASAEALACHLQLVGGDVRPTRFACGDAHVSASQRRCSSRALPAAQALGGEGTEAADAFERIYRERLLAAYPPRPDGSTIFPFHRFFVVASRPSLSDIYSEYASYHNHQLDKGWKS